MGAGSSSEDGDGKVNDDGDGDANGDESCDCACIVGPPPTSAAPSAGAISAGIISICWAIATVQSWEKEALNYCRPFEGEVDEDENRRSDSEESYGDSCMCTDSM